MVTRRGINGAAEFIVKPKYTLGDPGMRWIVKNLSERDGR